MVGVDNSSLSELTNESLSSLGSCRRFFPVPSQGHRYELETTGTCLQMLYIKHIFCQKSLTLFHFFHFSDHMIGLDEVFIKEMRRKNSVKVWQFFEGLTCLH